jgi:uncharacterized membrane protein
MQVELGRALERSEPGYHALSWLLYIGLLVIAASPFIDISGTTVVVGSIIILVLAMSRRSDAAGTIYGNHLSNIFTVTLVNMVVGFLLLSFTILTLGLGIIISWPLSIILVVWSAWRVVRGMLKLNDGQAYP